MVRRRSRRGSGGRRDAGKDIPTGPFSDIAFLLIIFFVVAATLIKTKGFSTEFPSGQENQEAKESDNTVVMTPDELTFNEKKVTIAQLRSKLDDMKLAGRRSEQDRMIVVEAHPQVKYGTYFQVMAAISRAGGIPAIVRDEKSGGGG
jgi:biopolymer transport protein ExbD